MDWSCCLGPTRWAFLLYGLLLEGGWCQWCSEFVPRQPLTRCWSSPCGWFAVLGLLSLWARAVLGLAV